MTKVVSIIAGGWSAGQIELARLPGTIIACNDSAVHAPRWNIAVSMDRIWTEQRWGHLTRRGMPAWLRRAALVNIARPLPDWAHPFDCDWRTTLMSREPGTLNGTNTGLCAFNLAYRERPDWILLAGFDGQPGPNGEKHWHPDYPWPNWTKPAKLSGWAREYDSVAGQCKAEGIKVAVLGERSLITSFPKMSLEEALKCIDAN